jgi:hypothetical protein
MEEILCVSHQWLIATRFAACTDHSADTEAQKKILAEDPEMSLRYRKNIESEISSRFRFILNGSQEQATASAVCFLKRLVSKKTHGRRY